MRLHTPPSLFLMAAIALSRSTAAQETTPNAAENLVSGAETAAPDVVSTGGEPRQVTFLNPIPEFLRDRELPSVEAGKKIVTLPVTADNWGHLACGDTVRVAIVSKNVIMGGGFGGSTYASEVTRHLARSAEVIAISDFAPPVDSPAPVCVAVTPDEARQCLESLAGEGQFVLTVVREHQTAVPDTVNEQPSEPRSDTTASQQPPRSPDESGRGARIEAATRLPELRLTVDATGMIAHTSRFTGVQVADDSVVSTDLTSTYQLRVTGKRAGSTTISLIDEHRKQFSIEVVVTRETGELQQILDRLYPDAGIEVIGVNDALLLRGTALDGNQEEEIIEIAGEFAPRILNQLETTDRSDAVSESQESQIPPGMRVVTLRNNEEQILTRMLLPSDHVDVLVTYKHRDQTGALQTVTRTAVRQSKVFSVNNQQGAVSLLVTPRAVNLIRSAETRGTLSLSWLNPNDVEDSGIGVPNEELLDQLAGIAPESETAFPHAGDASEEPSGALRRDLRALHEDVRQLIEILRQRADEPEEEEGEDTAVLENGMSFFTADRDVPCREMQPIVEQMAEAGRRVCVVDDDRDRNLAERYEVSSIPAYLIMKDGRVVGPAAGVMTAEQLQDLYKVGMSEPPVTSLERGAIEKALRSLLHRGTSPLAFDFALPIENQPADDERIFSFYVGITR